MRMGAEGDELGVLFRHGDYGDRLIVNFEDRGILRLVFFERGWNVETIESL